jgi:S1-C subfamily serine protease
VTVKVVIKTEVSMMGQAQNEESRSELPGVVVDESGLIMISNAEISADRVKEALSGNPMAANLDLTMTPTDFQVIFGDEEREFSAFLVAKDTKLDLAFLQVEDLEDRKPAAVSFAEGAKPAIGDTVVSISRLKKGFDYAVYGTTARISGAIRKPRKAWIIDGAVDSYGLPIFSSSGRVVGVLITLAPTTTDDSGGSSFGGMMRMLRGGGMDSGVGTFVLPAKVVNGLIKQSRVKAVELLEESAEDG